jgi:hypothetical protein
MNNPNRLAKISILISEGLKNLIKEENPQIEIPPEIMGLNQRQRIFIGLAATRYVSQYISKEFEKDIDCEFSPVEIFIASMFAVGLAAGGAFKILNPSKSVILEVTEKGVLTRQWIVSDEEVEEMTKYKDIIDDFINKKLKRGFHFALFLNKIVDEFPLEALVDLVLGEIFNLSFDFKDEIYKLSKVIDFLIFVQELVNYFTKKEA